MLCVVGLLFVVTAVYLSLNLVGDREFLILASVSPAIVAAFALGLMLLLRVLRPPQADEPPADGDGLTRNPPADDEDHGE